MYCIIQTLNLVLHHFNVAVNLFSGVILPLNLKLCKMSNYKTFYQPMGTEADTEFSPIVYDLHLQVQMYITLTTGRLLICLPVITVNQLTCPS